MIICVCKAVSDRHIHQAAMAGEVVSLRDLTRELGVGTCCGKCVPAAREVLAKTRAQQPLPGAPGLGGGLAAMPA